MSKAKSVLCIVCEPGEDVVTLAKDIFIGRKVIVTGPEELVKKASGIIFRDQDNKEVVYAVPFHAQE